MAEAKHSVELPRGADMHLHVRDGSVLGGLVLCSALQFSRAIIMPNTVPPITTAEMAVRYRERILEALATEAKAAGIDPVPSFEPLMTLYLTDQCTPEIIAEAKRSGVVVACKLYPAGATTNSQSGVTDIESIFPVLAAMEEHGLVLCVHGEVTDPLVDVFDRERVFIERVLRPIYQRFSRLRIVLEHATTEEAVNFVLSDETERVAATLTCHHLLHTRSDIFRGGLNPHYYCLPVLKSERDRNALLIAATGGSGRFFAGTDSAPHPRGKKECTHGSAGCFTSPLAIELYTEAFASCNKLSELPRFLSEYGLRFYGLRDTTKMGEEGETEDQSLSKIRVQKIDAGWKVPGACMIADELFVPFRGSELMHWRSSTSDLFFTYAHSQ